MGRLHCIILYTPELDRQKAFYSEKLGLGVSHASPEWVGFALRGASLALHAAKAGTPAELQLAITAIPLEPRIEALKARGVTFDGEIEDAPTCRLAVLRDPEGNRVQLVEPKGAGPEGLWPRLSHAIVNAARFASTTHFYREVLGLRVADERDGWVEFDTGPTRLTIHDREDADGLPLHAEQRIAFAFQDEDFDTWAEELRGRGVSFAAAPMEEGELGVQAEVEDADGWFVVLHGPPPAPPREEELAEDYIDEDEPLRTQMIRKPGETQGESTKKRLTAAKLARKSSERAATKSFETPRTREPERGGFPSRSEGPGGLGGGARPGGGFDRGPRPAGPPRPGGFDRGPRPAGPGGPGGPPRPGGFDRGPRPAGPGGSGGSGGPPRPGGFDRGPRPAGSGGPPRPGGFDRGPRPGGSGGAPRPGGGGTPRPGGPPRRPTERDDRS
jgi:catechol 2,3-dioxygenase-like lactoylglutathione lyase family enzyme